MFLKPTVPQSGGCLWLCASFANFFIIFAIISKYSFVFVCLILLAEALQTLLPLAQPLPRPVP